jgi:hypothetical protein
MYVQPPTVEVCDLQRQQCPPHERTARTVFKYLIDEYTAFLQAVA